MSRDAELDEEVKAAVELLRAALEAESQRIWLNLWGPNETRGIREDLQRFQFELAVEEEVLHGLLGYCKQQRRRTEVGKVLRGVYE